MSVDSANKSGVTKVASGTPGSVSAAIGSAFWSRYQKLVQEQILPYQWKALNDEIEDAPKSYSIENMRISAKMSDGEYRGMVFQDSDLSKWMEAVGHALRSSSLTADTREALERRVQEAIDIVAAAQQPDGYLNSYFTVKEPERKWTNLRDAHELYCAGHLIEAAVAVFHGTGERKLLDVVIRLADHIDSTFGREEGKKRGYPGHQEIELALMKLYRTTGEQRYFDLAKYFIDERGGTPNYFDVETKSGKYHAIWKDFDDHSYRQAHMPVREQRDAVGHSVRAMYQYIAMADIALETGETELIEACRALWESTTERRMYVTGGIGSTRHGEAFTADYDLPSDTAYAETCAAIGLFIFANRMAHLENKGKYADVAELALFNGIISGLSLDGTRYFYVNPLEVVPQVCDTNGAYEHVKYRRQGWYGCACCPPNVARILASLADYAYRVDDDTLFIDQYCGGSVDAGLSAGSFALEQEGDYPWSGELAFRVIRAPSDSVRLGLRIPGWCDEAKLSVNGTEKKIETVRRNGYAILERTWKAGDTINLSLPMPVRVLRSHPRVKATYGRVAIARGPVVYCLEECDNGANLHAATLSARPELSAQYDESMLEGLSTISASGYLHDGSAESGAAALYRAEGGSTSCGSSGTDPGSPEKAGLKKTKLTFIPYFAWANRSPGEMIVWVREGA